MSEERIPPPRLDHWNADLEVTVCERCQWRFLAPPGNARIQCPHCHQQTLTPMPDGLPEMPHPYPPELIVPFSLPKQKMQIAIEEFSKGIPFAPDDLKPQTLLARLAPVYLPLWLVDASVQGIWQAEAGFDYQVISHQESYNQNESGWQTREIKEDRIQWEKRVGRLNRMYHNITSSALEDAPRLRQSLGEFQQASALPYQPELIHQAYVRLPDLPPEEAWKEAVPSFQKVAADECRQACAAGHLREYRWKAAFNDINWTLMLVPVFTSYYLDDAKQPQPVLIHGQTGSLAGMRQASMQRARHASLMMLLSGIILFLFGLILDSFASSPAAAGLSTFITLTGIVDAVGSFVPIAAAWDFNRKQSLREAQVGKT